MTIQQIIVLAAAGIISSIGFIFKEVIKEFIKKIISGLSPMQVTSVFLLLIIFAFGFLSFIGFKITDDQEAPLSETTNAFDNPSDAQVYAELTKTGLKEVKELSDKKHIKDSIRIATKEKEWVYQVGLPKKDESDAWETTKTLQDIPGICIFKESRKSYLIICEKNYSEKMLTDSLESFRSLVESLSPENKVKIIDINSFCSKRQKLIETGRVTKRKHKESFRCVTCE